MKRSAMLLVGSLVLFGLTQAASASYIQIQLGGVDLRYNGNNIFDWGAENPDPLTNATFLVEGVPVLADTTDVTMDLFIPGVFNIPVGGGQVDTGADGNLDLDLGAGEHLWLTLDSAKVSYIPLTETIQFVFIGAASSIDSQQLPANLYLAEPVSVTFSTQVTEPISHSNGFVTVFVSAGTGEIQGVPEPGAMCVLALGGLGALIRRRRK